MAANVQLTSGKRPAIHVLYFEYICWKFAGRLLDRVNTLSSSSVLFQALGPYTHETHKNIQQNTH